MQDSTHGCQSSVEMVYSVYTKKRIVFYSAKKYKPPNITKLLFKRENIVVSRQGIDCFLKIYKETGIIDRHLGSGRKAKTSTGVRRIVEEQMRSDNETTAVQLHQLLISKGYKLSFSTILRFAENRLDGHTAAAR